jgi:hypothetical protein
MMARARDRDISEIELLNTYLIELKSDMHTLVSFCSLQADFTTAVETKVWAILSSNCAVHFVLAE